MNACYSRGLTSLLQENDPVTLRRLAVLNCQLRKSENEKRTLQVANDQLMQFAEVNVNI